MLSLTAGNKAMFREAENSTHLQITSEQAGGDRPTVNTSDNTAELELRTVRTSPARPGACEIKD